jgi:hypothetical protein
LAGHRFAYVYFAYVDFVYVLADRDVLRQRPPGWFQPVALSRGHCVADQTLNKGKDALA